MNSVSSCANSVRHCDGHPCPYGDQFTYACNSLRLGGLTKCLKEHGLLSPRPKEPFQGWAFESIREGLEITLSTTDEKCAFKVHNAYNPCQYSRTVIQAINEITCEAEGLDLKNFTDRGEETESI
jgi:hypothetical protein